MWARLVVSVILLPMLVHSILGCCWHHAHSECDFPCEYSTTESHACHRHAHDQRSEKNEPVIPAPCERGESCDDVHCVYLVPTQVRNELVFDLRVQVAELDSYCILVPNATVMASRNPQFSLEVSGSSQHRALTQVWVV